MTGYVLRDIIRRQGRRARRLARQEADTMTEHDTRPEREYTGPTAASAIAMAMVTKKLREGGTISFPSLGITLDASNLKGEAMTERDTTDHVAAIREAMENTWTGDDEGYVVVIAHADALAARLAAAEAGCRKLITYSRFLEDELIEKWDHPAGLTMLEIQRGRSHYKVGHLLTYGDGDLDGSDDDA